MRYAVVGASAAGLAAAEGVLEVDPSAEVTLITEEPHGPYSRPLISYWLSGETPEAFFPLPSSVLDRVELRTEARVEAVDPQGRTLRLAGGGTLRYDRLLLATGVHPNPLGLPGEGAENVVSFYFRDDADRMDREIGRGARRALVLGGGLIGVKAAHALARRGVEVTVCIGSAHPLSQVVDARAGGLVGAALEAEGIDVRTGHRPVALEVRNGRVEAVRFEPPGTTLPCDLVVRAKGVAPRVELLQELGVGGPDGIPVDRHLRAPLPGVWAAGDVALAHDVAWGEPRPAAIWPRAVEQGRVAGRNMAGAAEPYGGSLATNALKVGDLYLVSAGVTRPPPGGGFRTMEAFEPSAGTYRKVVLRNDRIVGAIVAGPEGERGGPDRAGVLVWAIRRGLGLADLPFDPLRDPIDWSGFAFPTTTRHASEPQGEQP